jgi:hypothetical protein
MSKNLLTKYADTYQLFKQTEYKPYRIRSYSIPANGSVTDDDIAFNHLRILSTTHQNLNLYINDGDKIDLSLSTELFYIDHTPFYKYKLENKTAVICAVTLIIATQITHTIIDISLDDILDALKKFMTQIPDKKIPFSKKVTD